MSALLELAARCEAATGADRDLDAEIFALVAGGRFWPETSRWWVSEGGLMGGRFPITFTASLDAGSSLFPEDCFYRSGHDGAGPDVTMFFCQAIIAFCDPVKAVAMTEPLARIAAALLSARRHA